MSDEAEGEIYRVNKLLAIEDLDWKNQLEKAVCFLLQSRSRSFVSPIFLRSTDFLLSKLGQFDPQGFKDCGLTVWDASCVLQNYERWTGHILTREELDSGFLKEELIDDDYIITTPVFT